MLPLLSITMAFILEDVLKVLDETDNLQKPNPPAPLPYVSAACRRLGRGVSKPLPTSGRGLQEGFVYRLKTFQTPS